MATSSKNISKLVFCRIDNDKVAIPIEYISLPDDSKLARRFAKQFADS